MIQNVERPIPRRHDSVVDLGEELFTRVRAVAVQPTPRALSPLGRRVVVAFALPLSAALVLLARHLLFGRAPLRLDLCVLDPEQVIPRFGLLAGVTIAVTFAAIRSGQLGLGSSATSLAATGAAVLPAFALIQLVQPLRSEAPEVVDAVTRLHPLGQPCMLVAATTGTIVFFVLIWALRRSVPAAPRLRGMAAGAAAGAWSGFALLIHCPASNPVHILAGHLAPTAMFTLMGLLVAPRFLRS